MGVALSFFGAARGTTVGKFSALILEESLAAHAGSCQHCRRPMIELIQFPWSNFCLVQRRILEFSGTPHKLINVPNTDRSLVWKITKERYYNVPVLRDGRNIVFETDENSQVIAKYLDDRLQLGLFPHHLDGVQDIIWRFIENDIESISFKLSDADYQKIVPRAEWLAFRRHKERKFGRGCLEQWRAQESAMRRELAARLGVFEQMLATRDFLLEDRPRFVDFELWGMMANLLYSGRHSLPASLPHLRKWYARMSKIKNNSAAPSGSRKRPK